MQAATQYVFSPKAVPSLAIKGMTERFPARRIYCVGRNYVAHAQEMGFTGKEAPFFFLKPADSLLAVPSGTIGEMPYPTLTQNLHYECELVVAINRGGKDISVEDA